MWIMPISEGSLKAPPEKIHVVEDKPRFGLKIILTDLWCADNNIDPTAMAPYLWLTLIDYAWLIKSAHAEKEHVTTLPTPFDYKREI